jgi:hypothetical protein
LSCCRSRSLRCSADCSTDADLPRPCCHTC